MAGDDVALAVASMLALFRWKRPMPRRLLILTAVWLAIFFGRTTWGYFMLALGLPANVSCKPFRVGLRVVCGSADGLGICQNSFGRVADRILRASL